MNPRVTLCALALLATIPFARTATATTWCTGTVQAVYLASDGAVVIEGSWRGDFTEICNEQGTFGGIDQPRCLAWYAAAVSAERAQSKVELMYPIDTYTCANLPTYSNSPAPYYFMNTQ